MIKTTTSIDFGLKSERLFLVGGGPSEGITWLSWVISRNQQSKMGGTVENDLPFYCHQGEGGHKNTKQLQPGELFRFRVTTKFLLRKKI